MHEQRKQRTNPNVDVGASRSGGARQRVGTDAPRSRARETSAQGCGGGLATARKKKKDSAKRRLAMTGSRRRTSNVAPWPPNLSSSTAQSRRVAQRVVLNSALRIDLEFKTSIPLTSRFHLKSKPSLFPSSIQDFKTSDPRDGEEPEVAIAATSRCPLQFQYTSACEVLGADTASVLSSCTASPCSDWAARRTFLNVSPFNKYLLIALLLSADAALAKGVIEGHGLVETGILRAASLVRTDSPGIFESRLLPEIQGQRRDDIDVAPCTKKIQIAGTLNESAGGGGVKERFSDQCCRHLPCTASHALLVRIRRPKNRIYFCRWINARHAPER
ncbi:hypothetical protein C8R45DRAFT_943576 [Mycena sanguinolenta]|nr:hypothetical protein C8R45DRAFT_943576 [Mycena sanguinolenta]